MTKVGRHQELRKNGIFSFYVRTVSKWRFRLGSLKQTVDWAKTLQRKIWRIKRRSLFAGSMRFLTCALFHLPEPKDKHIVVGLRATVQHKQLVLVVVVVVVVVVVEEVEAVAVAVVVIVEEAVVEVVAVAVAVVVAVAEAVVEVVEVAVAVVVIVEEAVVEVVVVAAEIIKIFSIKAWTSAVISWQNPCGHANRFCCCSPYCSFLECDRVFCHRKLATRTCCEKNKSKKLAKLTWCAPFKTLPKHSLCSEECISAIGESCAPKQKLKNYQRSKHLLSAQSWNCFL